MSATQPYCPPANDADWGRTDASAAGFDAAGLNGAVAFAEANESQWPRSFYYPDGRYVGIVEWNEKGPWSEVTGPVKPRGGPAGLVLRGGQVVAEWGDTARTDMTFSVAKSYLAVLAGVAVGAGLIENVEAPVGESVPGAWFEGEHNGAIRWRHLLQQSSEWSGVLWEKSDQVDHNRQLGLGADNSRKGDKRARQAPGTFYEYNDVRVNLLALALAQRFGRGLPDILAEHVMGPIGASQDWQWHGYSTSWTDIAGRRVQSVSGGAHWGGGMFISARDHARMGLLVARGGNWDGQQLLPAGYVADMLRPSPTHEGYGYLWWLNRGKGARSSWPEGCVSAMGAGTNLVWVDAARDIVVVLRWIDKTAVGGFLDRLAAAIVR